MNQNGKHLAVLAAFALIASACVAPGAADVTSSEPSFAKSDNAPVNQVSGGGTIDVPLGRSTYAFHASRNGAGDVKGGFELHFSSIDANVHGDVTCLQVFGNVALMAGVVTRSSDETLMATGTALRWAAQDRGEGSNALPDLVSGFAGTLNPAICDDAVGIAEWTNGNVQIR